MTTVFVCSNKNCRATHALDPHGHCPKCKREDGSGWSCVTTDVPRRRRIDLASSGENAIREAIAAVQGMGADPRLTDAVVLLGSAQEAVANFVDDVPRQTPQEESDDLTKLPLSDFDTTTLGALIAALRTCNQNADVQFDFCYLAPTTLASYRGSYDQLALGWTNEYKGDGHWPKVSVLLAELIAAVGETFEGWKGGDYTMSLDTPLWAANRGHSGSTAIIAIKANDHTVVLVTKNAE